MLLRLFNGSISFQDYITKILAKKLNFFIIIYVDNILIYKKILDNHSWKPLDKSLNCFKNTVYLLFWRNVNFIKMKKKLLNFVVLALDIKIKEEKIKIIKIWPELLWIKDIQVFLGYSNYYSRVIRILAKIITLFPLIKSQKIRFCKSQFFWNRFFYV